MDSANHETALANEKLKTEQEKGKLEAANARVAVYELFRTSAHTQSHNADTATRHRSSAGNDEEKAATSEPSSNANDLEPIHNPYPSGVDVDATSSQFEQASEEISPSAQDQDNKPETTDKQSEQVNRDQTCAPKEARSMQAGVDGTIDHTDSKKRKSNTKEPSLSSKALRVGGGTQEAKQDGGAVEVASSSPVTQINTSHSNTLAPSASRLLTFDAEVSRMKTYITLKRFVQ